MPPPYTYANHRLYKAWQPGPSVVTVRRGHVGDGEMGDSGGGGGLGGGSSSCMPAMPTPFPLFTLPLVAFLAS